MSLPTARVLLSTVTVELHLTATWIPGVTETVKLQNSARLIFKKMHRHHSPSFMLYLLHSLTIFPHTPTILVPFNSVPSRRLCLQRDFVSSNLLYSPFILQHQSSRPSVLIGKVPAAPWKSCALASTIRGSAEPSTSLPQINSSTCDSPPPGTLRRPAKQQKDFCGTA